MFHKVSIRFNPFVYEELQVKTKNQTSFAHLHVHTHYSLLKSSCTVSHLVDKCLEDQQPAIAITDYGNMFGALDLYFKAKEKGITPILGLEIYLISGSPSSQQHYPSAHAFHVDAPTLVLLAQDIKGYRNLCHINTIACQKGFYYVPRVDEDTLKQYSSSLIALTGGMNSTVRRTFLKKGHDPTLTLIKKLKSIYGDGLYLQLNRMGLKEEESFNHFLVEASKITGTDLTVGNDVHYLNKNDSALQDILFCIGSNRTLKDPDRFKFPSDQFYLKSTEEMTTLFKDQPTALNNVMDIVSRCHLHFQLKKEGRPIYHLPKLYQIDPQGAEKQNVSSQQSSIKKEKQNAQEQLRELSFKGLKDRWKECPSPTNTDTSIITDQTKTSIDKEQKKIPEDSQLKYQTRLEEELKIINNMGFADYFLIVHDFVHWARKQGIPVGPGRGSGASSLVAWCLKITDLDPMPYNLLFERFLNPERISLPDFDIDFCQENRNRVIAYVSEKYGKDYVAQVMTYGRLQARAAIRDVGRVLSMSYAEVDQVVRLIPERIGISLKSAIEENPSLKELMESDPQVDNLIHLSRRIEGLVRHVSIHAAGVIIADHPIIHFAPLYRGAEGENVIQCDLNHSKKIGLVKFDFLGLKTLTQIQSAFRMIEKIPKVNQHSTGKKLSVQDISLKDPGIYEIMRKGDTKGIFQFEGEGITNLIIKAEPSCFEDIVALNALFRPGPMDMIPSYLDRKKGKVRVEYLFKEMEPILKETYGIIVYQEQVLLIASKIAGYSYGEADVLRRAMGEKKPAVMKKQKNRFLNGAIKNGYDRKKSEKLFDLVEEFAKYGFNKSHATAYCVLAAQTAWLKRYYPLEFFASLLSVEMNNTDKVVAYMRDIEKQGIKISPPHVNHSEYHFTPRMPKGHDSSIAVEKNTACGTTFKSEKKPKSKRYIYFSLGAIKGVGKAVADHIAQVRETLPKGSFISIQHFFESVDIKKINKKAVEALAKAGAFDGMEMNRREILSNYESIVEQVEKKKEEKESGQINLFASPKQKSSPFIYDKKTEWPRSALLDYEKSVVGFYLSGHPMNPLQAFRNKCGCVPLSSLMDKAEKTEVCVWGILSEFREVRTKKGTTMAFARLEDGSGSVDLVFFADVYSKYEHLVRSKWDPIVIVGEWEKAGKILVREVYSMQDRLHSQARGLLLKLNESEENKLNAIKQLLNQHKGTMPLYFNIKLKNPVRTVCLKSSSFHGVNLNMAFLEQAQQLLGQHKVEIC